jgi:hypothetical protein
MNDYYDWGAPRKNGDGEIDTWQKKARKQLEQQHRQQMREQERANADAASLSDIASMYVQPVHRTFKRWLYRYAPK